MPGEEALLAALFGTKNAIGLGKQVKGLAKSLENYKTKQGKKAKAIQKAKEVVQSKKAKALEQWAKSPEGQEAAQKLQDKLFGDESTSHFNPTRDVATLPKGTAKAAQEAIEKKKPNALLVSKNKLTPEQVAAQKAAKTAKLQSEVGQKVTPKFGPTSSTATPKVKLTKKKFLTAQTKANENPLSAGSKAKNALSDFGPSPTEKKMKSDSALKALGKVSKVKPTIGSSPSPSGGLEGSIKKGFGL